MPSFKSCIFGLALVAAAFSPVSAAVIGGSALELSERDLAAPAALLARSESRQDSYERVRLAKARAARSVKRALPPSNCFPPNVTTTPDFGTYQLRSVGCKLICSHAAGYHPAPNQLACVKTVPAVSCGTGDIIIDGQKVGVHVLRGNVCKTICYKSTGYRVQGDTCFRAYNPAADPDHCGTSNANCPSGYPDGTAACVNGICTLSCTTGVPTPVAGTPFQTCA